MTLKRLSLVVPVYNEVEGIRAFNERALTVMKTLPELDYEIIYVDDGCKDGSYTLLEEFASANEKIRVVKLSRNFGHQIAITAGLDHATGDVIVFIDADLQDPPEVILQMIAKWREGFDVVYGQRRRREGESAFKLATASVFYRMLRSLASIDIPPDVGDFRLISRRVADQLRALREKDRYIRGLVSWVGFKQAAVVYDRDERVAGVTKYPLRKMIKFALDGLTSFSTAPLRVATWMGYTASVMAFLYLAVVLVQVAMGVTVDGWASIMVVALFIGGVQLICLGILGEYIGRVFNEVKPRPIYIVEEITTANTVSTADAASGIRPALTAT